MKSFKLLALTIVGFYLGPAFAQGTYIPNDYYKYRDQQKAPSGPPKSPCKGGWIKKSTEGHGIPQVGGIGSVGPSVTGQGYGVPTQEIWECRKTSSLKENPADQPPLIEEAKTHVILDEKQTSH